MAIATFGAGCFWGVEAAFRKLPGVLETAVGYSGGATENATYENICSGKTGHAEVVQIEYDSDIISYETLLEIFWESHDPTQLNRQGPDVGTQYRSVIYYHDESQREAAKNSMELLSCSGEYSKPIATELAAVCRFWRAEDYHQHYLEKRGLGSCRI